MSGVFNCYIGFGNFSIGYEQLIQSVIAGQRQLPRHRGNNRLCSYGIAAGFQCSIHLFMSRFDRFHGFSAYIGLDPDIGRNRVY